MRVSGNTFEMRGTLKEIGGKWDAANKSWILAADVWAEFLDKCISHHYGRKINRLAQELRVEEVAQ